MDVCKRIINNKVNVDEIFEEYIKYVSDGEPDYNFSVGTTGIVYNLLLKIKKE